MSKAELPSEQPTPKEIMNDLVDQAAKGMAQEEWQGWGEILQPNQRSATFPNPLNRRRPLRRNPEPPTNPSK